jgi:type I restriction enzyme S subunit
MRVIRGTDFQAARLGDSGAFPVRYIRFDLAERKTLRPWDLLIETAGGSPERPTGRTVLIQPRLLKRADLPVTCASFARFLRIDETRAVPAFVYWYLQYLYSSGEMEQHQVQHTGIARFQFTLFADSTRVLLPSLAQQQAIANILGTLDDKIELNRRMNETLEAMARALFESWFVEFDPVRAKAEGRDPGLPKHLADLFPDSFQDSELGEIPNGWRVARLGQIADVNWGDTNVTKASYVPAGHRAYSAKGPDGFLPYSDFDRTGVVVSAIGANCGRTWLADGKWSCIKNTIRFWATHDGVATEYLYYATLGSERWPKRGSAQPFIAQQDARALPVLLPANQLARHFGDRVRPLHELIQTNESQSEVIGTIRDALLPKLISGEIRVKDATDALGKIA